MVKTILKQFWQIFLRSKNKKQMREKHCLKLIWLLEQLLQWILTHTHTLSLSYRHTRSHSLCGRVLTFQRENTILRSQTVMLESANYSHWKGVNAKKLHCKKVLRFSVEFQIAEWLQQYLYLSWGVWKCYTIQQAAFVWFWDIIRQ